MEHRRPDHAPPGGGSTTGPLAGERSRPAGTARPGGTGDAHVAGPPPESPVLDAPETVPDTAPDRRPAAGGTAPSPSPTPSPSSGGTPSPTGIPAPGEASSPGERPSGSGNRAPGRAPSPGGTPAKLFDPAESDRFKERWRDVQSAFIDDPGDSVRKADDLASEAVDALGRAIAEQRRRLSEGLADRDDADTERLRLALRGYRDLLDRIFAA
ncbi:hypothetical protein [Actinomadura livida]|uniref:Uncharacterized protein n=1 Tax=Actinomadura livida TaxID=79909 RepID=A0A7W7MYK5_9ACTN|nr:MULTISPECIES: hypothetical protein [Actinomadura]MBB4775084.1 hypothetical protein [Actinomadura catellatispora]GGT87675.1 hypothetical protein GCM10010208_07950 [Actinomadura livida]